MFFFVSLHKNHRQKQIIMAEINDYRKDLRQRIIDYAMPEFYKRGIRAVKMDEISQFLHVSKRTVYEIFGDKEELLLAGMQQCGGEMHRKLEEYARNEAHNVIDILGYFYKIQMHVNQQVGVAFYEEIHHMKRIQEYMERENKMQHEDRIRFLEAGVEEGLFRKDLDYQVAMELIHVSMSEIMHQQLYKKYTMQQLFDNYLLIVFRGICTERGLTLLNKALN